MRTLSDCIGDMLRRRIEDREIEYLLSRQARNETDGLVSVLATVNLERLGISVDDRAADFAVTASRLVGHTEPETTIRPLRSRVVPRLATAALTAVLVMGLAGVADAAAPGDSLYGLDRALERIGINAGGLDERLDEAQALDDDGQSAEALAHLADALDNSSPRAADALEKAADRFGVHDNPSQAVLEDVSAMLDWMAETGASGRDFGQGVAQLAREIGAGHAEDAPAASPDTSANDQGNNGNADRPVDDDGDTNANTNDGSGNSEHGSSDSSGNGGRSDTGGRGGNGGENGPPGGSPPGRRAP